MPKPEWGVKRSCLSCGARFYDLLRDPVICPKCGAEFDIATLSKPRRMKAEKPAPAAAAAAAPDLIDDEAEGTEDLATVDEEDALAHTDDDDEEDDTQTPVKKPEVAESEDADDLTDYGDDPLIDDEEETDENFHEVLGSDKDDESG